MFPTRWWKFKKRENTRAKSAQLSPHPNETQSFLGLTTTELSYFAPYVSSIHWAPYLNNMESPTKWLIAGTNVVYPSIWWTFRVTRWSLTVILRKATYRTKKLPVRYILVGTSARFVYINAVTVATSSIPTSSSILSRSIPNNSSTETRACYCPKCAKEWAILQKRSSTKSALSTDPRTALYRTFCFGAILYVV